MFYIVAALISTSRHVRFIANLGDRRGVDAIFNKGVYTWLLKIVTDGQTDRSSAAFWSTSLWGLLL